MSFPILSQDQARALAYAASVLNIPAKWLQDLINFESGFNPLARNKITGARGLIQFMPSTAADMGFAGARSIKDGAPTAADTLIEKYPDISSQLEIVVRYLKPMAPFPSVQSLNMAVFYPKYRSVAATTAFPPAVQAANPGIKTVADYLRRASPVAAKAAALVLAAGAAGLFFSSFVNALNYI